MEVTGSARAQPVGPAAVADAAGSQVALWIDEHGPAVLRLAYAMLLDRALAEDVFQDVFLKAYRHVHRLREPERIRPWLLQVTANRCRDLRRSAWWRRILPLQPGWTEAPQQAGGDPAAGQSDAQEAVATAVWALPEGYRETVVLYYYEGFSTPEVARLLEVSEGTVHSRLHRARQMLKERLHQWEGRA